MRWPVRCYLAANAAGAILSIRNGRPARFAGVPLPGTPAQHALTIGTPLSAPPVLLVALILAERSGNRRLLRWLCATFIVGALGEPDTWTAMRHPAAAPVSTACTALEIVLPGFVVTPRS